MEIVVTSAEMQAYDRLAIQRYGISGIVLMENAGRGVVERLQAHYGSVAGKKIIVFCGKGNNGGDGLVIARYLHQKGARVIVLLVGNRAGLKPDSRTNYLILRKIEETVDDPGMLRIIHFKATTRLLMLPKADFIVDALFGTGFRGKVKNPYLRLIEWMNSQPSVRIAVDVPSGFNADTGEVGNISFKSDLTLTLGFRKTGFNSSVSRRYTGLLEVLDIGIPTESRLKVAVKTFLVAGSDIHLIMPERQPNAHKYSVGKVFVVAGARGLTGAAAMTSQATMRAGAGAVILGTPASLYRFLARKLTEVMVEPLDDTKEGTLALSSLEAIAKHIEWSDLVIIGPGCSRDSQTQELIRALVAITDRPLLIDADGLNALVGNLRLLKARKAKAVVLTPHRGEFARLTGLAPCEIELHSTSHAREFAVKYDVTLVLKGAPTVTAAPDGRVFINSSGNPGMATAGSGDVLTGTIGGLWSQGMKPVEASYAGVYLHGMAGDLAAAAFGQKSMMATDILEMLPRSFLQMEQTRLAERT